MSAINVVEFRSQGGRIAQFRGSRKRRITVAYRRNDDGTLSYGGVIFRPVGNESWDKKGHTQTAINRLILSPVTIPDDPEWTTIERQKEVRLAMARLGATGCRIG